MIDWVKRDDTNTAGYICPDCGQAISNPSRHSCRGYSRTDSPTLPRHALLTIFDKRHGGTFMWGSEAELLDAIAEAARNLAAMRELLTLAHQANGEPVRIVV